MGRIGASRAFATFINHRSAGIKDLRYGNVTDEDWQDHDPDALLRDTRGELALVGTIRYHVIGARFTDGPIGDVLGDLMVRLPSATGKHRHGHRVLDFHRHVELAGINHLALLNHPVVYEHLHEALVADLDAPPGP
jgi:hypothetical protein